MRGDRLLVKCLFDLTKGENRIDVKKNVPHTSIRERTVSRHVSCPLAVNLYHQQRLKLTECEQCSYYKGEEPTENGLYIHCGFVRNKLDD